MHFCFHAQQKFWGYISMVRKNLVTTVVLVCRILLHTEHYRTETNATRPLRQKQLVITFTRHSLFSCIDECPNKHCAFWMAMPAFINMNRTKTCLSPLYLLLTEPIHKCALKVGSSKTDYEQWGKQIFSAYTTSFSLDSMPPCVFCTAPGHPPTVLSSNIFVSLLSKIRGDTT